MRSNGRSGQHDVSEASESDLLLAYLTHTLGDHLSVDLHHFYEFLAEAGTYELVLEKDHRSYQIRLTQAERHRYTHGQDRSV